MTLLVEEFDYLDSAALFAQVADQPWAIFLDSGVVGGRLPVTKHADYDVLAVDPITTLVTLDDKTTIDSKGKSQISLDDPLQILKKTLADFSPESSDDSSPVFVPGALGYFSYDLTRRYERLPCLAKDEEKLPSLAIGIYPVIVLVDHRRKRTQLIGLKQIKQSKRRIDQWKCLIENQAKDPQGDQDNQNRLQVENLQENMSRDAYKNCFDRIRDYTIEGDCYQVNLAKQFSAKVEGDTWQSYAYLRSLSPAPYGAYMNFPFAQILSNSPESFIQCRDRRVVTSPIKGTRPRHADKYRDAEIADELYNSDKDRAENLMIVDLMRNDLSKCCEHNSVEVPKLFKVHSFANVHHLISTVTGRLRKELHSLDLLKRCFPGGSITGAPKIRAMQIIEELEPNRRGLYCGAIAYIGLNGDMETNIAIRTIVVKDGVARYSSGGGLVIDSTLEEEYQEIIDKAKMMTKALAD